MMLTLVAVALFAAPLDGEVDALRNALMAAEPSPDHVRATLEAVARAGEVAAVPLLTEQFAQYGTQLREKGAEVEASLAQLRQLEEMSAELATRGQRSPSMEEAQEDIKLKLRKGEARRADLERTWRLLLEKFPEVLLGVADKGHGEAVEQYMACFVDQTQRMFSLDTEEEDLKGKIAGLEFAIRSFEGDWRDKTKILEDRAKAEYQLTRATAELRGHDRVRDATVRALSQLMQVLPDASRSKAADVLEDKLSKREPPLERAKYVGLFAGLGDKSTPKDLSKIVAEATRSLRADEEELDKVRKQAAMTRQAWEEHVASQKPNAEGMIMVNRRLKIANEQAAVDLAEAVATNEGWRRLRREAVWALPIAVRSLPEGTAREREFADLLRDAAKERDVTNRSLLVEALGRIDREDVREHLREQLMADKDPRVRVACMEALVQLQDRGALPEIREKLLVEEDWRLRAGAMVALGSIPAPENVVPLIDALATETGRLREDAIDALQLLTGQRIGNSPPLWRAWWRDNEAGFNPAAVARERRLALAPTSGEERGVTFYGISSTSGKVCFVLDISGSMAEPSSEGGERTKIEVAVRELKQAVSALRPEDTFSIVTFASNAARWNDRMSKAGDTEKKKALKWIDDEIVAEGATNLYGGIMEALKIAGIGTRDAKYEPGIDTIYVLSDGDPTAGDVTDVGELRRMVREANGLNRIRIHTIAVGQEANLGLLYGLAEDSGGLFIKR